MSKVRKALVAAVLAAVSTGAGVWPDGLTNPEIGLIAGAFVAAGLAVWRVPNAQPQPGAHG